MNRAEFTINGVDSSIKRGFDATPGQVLSLALLASPPSVSSCQFDIVPVVGSSKGASAVTFSSGGIANPVGSVVTMTVPAETVSHSYMVRCTVAYSGTRGVTENETFSRVVTVNVAMGRKILPQETIEYEPETWANAVNDIVNGPVVESWDPRIVVAGRRVVTYSGPPDAMLVRARDGHSPGGEKCIIFEPGSLTTMRVSPALNVQGDCAIDPLSFLVTDLDTDKRYALLLTQSQTVTVGSMRIIAEEDVSAPTIVRAVVDSLNPDAITIQFTKNMVFPTIAGMSLSFSVGTPRSIIGIESGNGSDTITFTLSGTVSSADVASLVVASNRTATDYFDNALATGTTPVTMVFGLKGRAAWTRCFEKGVAMLPSAGLPAALTSWTDQVSGSLQLVQTAGGGSASRTTSGLSFTADATERCKASEALTTGADFAFYVRAKFNTGGAHDWVPVAFDKDGGATFPWVFLRIISDGTNGTAIASVYESGGVFTELPWAFSSVAAEHDFFVWRSGGQLHMRIDGAVATPVASSAVVTGLSVMALGSALVPTAYKPDAGTVVHLCTKSNAGFVGTEIEDTIAYAATV